MTTRTNVRTGTMFALAIMMAGAVAVAGTVWAMGQNSAVASEGTMIDVSAMMTRGDYTNLPVLHIEDPI